MRTQPQARRPRLAIPMVANTGVITCKVLQTDAKHTLRSCITAFCSCMLFKCWSSKIFDQHPRRRREKRKQDSHTPRFTNASAAPPSTLSTSRSASVRLLSPFSERLHTHIVCPPSSPSAAAFDTSADAAADAEFAPGPRTAEPCVDLFFDAALVCVGPEGGKEGGEVRMGDSGEGETRIRRKARDGTEKEMRKARETAHEGRTEEKVIIV
ncbi:hypothetical protein K438DRAFT_1255060 [Mycena galopus ATCC 62051]|nr:hypothetical protein K438DRAFT_1255060 [Mycena galopus ATCC 62051]